MFCSVSAGVRAASQGDNLPLRSFAISGASTQGPRSELGAPWPLCPPLPAHSCSGRLQECPVSLPYFPTLSHPCHCSWWCRGGGRESPRPLPCSLLPAPRQGGPHRGRTRAGRGGVEMQSGAFFPFFFLVLRPGMWDLSAQTRERAHTPCSGGAES